MKAITKEQQAVQSEIGTLALITLDPARYVAEVFASFRTKLTTLVAASEAAKVAAPDLCTVAGMEIAIKHRASFRDELRIAGEKTRVDRKAPLLAIGKLIDAEYKDVAAAALPHEIYWDAAIKAEEARKEAEKQAKIAVERARVEGIQKMIQTLRDYPRMVLAQDPAVPSAALKAAIDEFDGWAPHADDYAEFAPVSADAIASSLETMRGMMAKELEREAAAMAAEQARLAEIARIAAERDELARLRADAAEAARIAKIESDRVAAAQAVEAKRLADLAAAQELAASQEREKAAAALKAERDAQAESLRIERAKASDEQAERDRIAAEAQAKANAELKAAQDKLNAEQAEFSRQQDEARALEVAKAKAVDDEAERARLQGLAEQHLADAVPTTCDGARVLCDIADDMLDELNPTDAEITAMGQECGLSLLEWVDRLELFVVAARVAARAELAMLEVA